jgi:dethiobiotin synthetase
MNPWLGTINHASITVSDLDEDGLKLEPVHRPALAAFFS